MQSRFTIIKAFLIIPIRVSYHDCLERGDEHSRLCGRPTFGGARPLSSHHNLFLWWYQIFPLRVFAPPYPLAFSWVLSSSNSPTPSRRLLSWQSDLEALFRLQVLSIIDSNLIPKNDDGNLQIDPPTSLDKAVNM
jgi:hypothetical protein